MTQFKIHNQVPIQLLRITAERETMDYIIQEMKQDLDDDMPAEELVRAFAKAPDKPTKLTTYHQMIAMEGDHPHVHMMAWSAKPGQAYLSRDSGRSNPS